MLSAGAVVKAARWVDDVLVASRALYQGGVAGGSGAVCATAVVGPGAPSALEGGGSDRGSGAWALLAAGGRGGVVRRARVSALSAPWAVGGEGSCARP